MNDLSTKSNAQVEKNFLQRQLAARPRLFASALLGVFAGAFLPESLVQREVTRIIMGWDFGVSLYLLLSMEMIWQSNHEKIHRRASLQNEGQFMILLLVVLSVIMSITAIVMELAFVKDMHGTYKLGHILLVSSTILLSWIFTHTMFAMHYAHDYYHQFARHKTKALSFPTEDMPDYWDFLYFSFIIGTSGQTADVSFSSRNLRRVGTFHCVLAFFFNTTVLALTINIASSLV